MPLLQPTRAPLKETHGFPNVTTKPTFEVMFIIFVMIAQQLPFHTLQGPI